MGQGCAQNFFATLLEFAHLPFDVLGVIPILQFLLVEVVGRPVAQRAFDYMKGNRLRHPDAIGTMPLPRLAAGFVALTPLRYDFVDQRAVAAIEAWRLDDLLAPQVSGAAGR